MSAEQIEAGAKAIHAAVRISIRPNGGTMELLEQGHTFHLNRDEATKAAKAAHAAFHPVVATIEELDALGFRAIIAPNHKGLPNVPGLPYVKGNSGSWHQIGFAKPLPSHWLADVLNEGETYTVLHVGGGSK